MSVQTEQFKDTLAAYNWTNTNEPLAKVGDKIREK